ncbi:aminotransferase-like domain-containing protein [Cellulosilyticum ruminicola]|uniref:aminotransferase-like domain-containing protein n=1 Tax=Cellulosilyticum ruminicola TaxID=425254 RepID=UPI0006D08EAD|nr:PLP-dependent aminotransferase family protein [Cellulosilyticum ruminicola]
MFHTVQLSKSDPTPLYIQLASELAKLIQANLLTGGTKLPAIRYLSKQLAINRDTVVSAYRLLENQGLVEGHIGKGTYVVPISQKSPSAPSVKSAHVYCSNLGFSKERFPPSICLNLATDLITKEGWEAFSDPLYRNRHFLKQNIGNFIAKNLNIHPHFSQVRLVKSMDQFFLSLFKLSPKSGVCVENYRDLAASCYLRSIGAKIYEVPLLKDGLDLNLLEKYLRTGTISYILVSSNFHNPTGICYTDSSKKALIDLAGKYDCYIIEDGTYNEFAFNFAAPLPLYEHYSKDRVIFLYHFSKLYMPYLSYSFAILPNLLIKRLSDDMTCTFNERLLLYYLDSSTLLEVKKELFNECQYKYNYLAKTLKSLSNKLIVNDLNGGLCFWIKSLYTNKETLYHYLSKHGFIVSPGNLFTTEDYCNFLRISISQLPMEDTEKLISLLNNFN